MNLPSAWNGTIAGGKQPWYRRRISKPLQPFGERLTPSTPYAMSISSTCRSHGLPISFGPSRDVLMKSTDYVLLSFLLFLSPMQAFRRVRQQHLTHTWLRCGPTFVLWLFYKCFPINNCHLGDCVSKHVATTRDPNIYFINEPVASNV